MYKFTIEAKQMSEREWRANVVELGNVYRYGSTMDEACKAARWHFIETAHETTKKDPRRMFNKDGTANMSAVAIELMMKTRMETEAFASLFRCVDISKQPDALKVQITNVVDSRTK